MTLNPAMMRLCSCHPVMRQPARRREDPALSARMAPQGRKAYAPATDDYDLRGDFRTCRAPGRRGQDLLLDFATGRRPIPCGPISSPAPINGPRTPAIPSRPRSITATSPRSRNSSFENDQILAARVASDLDMDLFRTAQPARAHARVGSRARARCCVKIQRIQSYFARPIYFRCRATFASG